MRTSNFNNIVLVILLFIFIMAIESLLFYGIWNWIIVSVGCAHISFIESCITMVVFEIIAKFIANTIVFIDKHIGE